MTKREQLNAAIKTFLQATENHTPTDRTAMLRGVRLFITALVQVGVFGPATGDDARHMLQFEIDDINAKR